MIKFVNVCKTYEHRKVLDNVTLSLPDAGLIFIHGPSGSGKTTLLNLLSGLIPFEGDIRVDEKRINLMNEKELSEFRIKQYGFIFQDYKLFENETVMNNILFPLETISVTSQEFKEQKCKELITLVGLKRNINQSVNKLSGGEKQRVAVARALINSPKILLADEPTGALDNKTAKDIMDILTRVSISSLVIVVSHDEDLSKNYADQIIYMSDGKITSIKYSNKKKHEKHFAIPKLFHTEKRPTISSRFLFHHTIASIKQRKWRTSVCNLMTSLGLIGVGLATTLSSCISTNIKNAYSSITDQSKIIVSLKDDSKSIYGQYAGSYYEANALKEKYSDYIYDIGVCYYANFETFFPDANYIALADTSYRVPIEGISARSINEFKWLDIESPTIYPGPIETLNDDQVVLGLSITMIQDICYQLQIERTVSSLSKYLQKNQLYFYFSFANNSWEYSDEQILEIAGFTLEKNPTIYHTNHLWNEYMFEERMRFPTSDIINSQSYYPWTLKKIYYFQSNNKTDDLIKLSLSNKEFDPYVLEIANKVYYPWNYLQTDVKNIERVLFFARTQDNISPSYLKHFKSISEDIINPIYGSYGGYLIYPSSMLIGFANYTYFSNHEDSLNELIDTTSKIKNGDGDISLPDDIVCGHYSKSFSGGVKFGVISNSPDSGSFPNSLDEIVISTGLSKKLFSNVNSIGQTLYLSSVIEQRVLSDSSVVRTYKTVPLKITGIVHNDGYLIYSDSLWPICFYQSRLGISAFNLSVNSVALDINDESKVDDIASELAKAFPDFTISNPMNDINQSVNQVCFYLEIALSAFSIIAIIISSILLSICNYLHILENKKDIGLARCLGINKKEANKFLLSHSLIMCLSSFVLSSMELFVISIIISYEISNQMGGSLSFSFNPLSLLYMFILALVISLLSCALINAKMNKMNPIEALKQ